MLDPPPILPLWFLGRRLEMRECPKPVLITFRNPARQEEVGQEGLDGHLVNQSLTARTHVIEKENELPQIVL